MFINVLLHRGGWRGHAGVNRLCTHSKDDTDSHRAGNFASNNVVACVARHSTIHNRTSAHIMDYPGASVNLLISYFGSML